MPDIGPFAQEAPLRLVAGLSPTLRKMSRLPPPLALLSAWSAELTASQALAVALLAALPLAFARDRWQGARVVLRPDGSADLERDAQAPEAVTTGRAWLLGRVAVLELQAGTRVIHLLICAALNRPDTWRRLRGWILLGRLGTGADTGARAG